MINEHNAPPSAEYGQKLISWAGPDMKALSFKISELKQNGILSGKSIGLSMRMDSNSGYLAQQLQETSANVKVLTNKKQADPDVLLAVEAAGVSVFDEQTPMAANTFFSVPVDVLIHHGTQSVTPINEHKKAVGGIVSSLSKFDGDIESLKDVALINLDQLTIRKLVDDEYGTGQSCVMAFVDITNLQLAGRKVLVDEYGDVGRGIAFHAAALGAQVTIADADPVKCVEALYKGHHVSQLTSALNESEVVFLTTDKSVLSGLDLIERMPNGAFICAAGSDQPHLKKLLDANYKSKPVRTSVEQFELGDRHFINLISHGNSVNTAQGAAFPNETMDIVHTMQLLGAVKLIKGELNTSGMDQELAGLYLKYHAS